MQGPQEQEPRRVWPWIVLAIVLLLGGVCILVPTITGG